MTLGSHGRSRLEDTPDLRSLVATSCRILAHRGLVQGILGHVSARVSDDELVIRCRTPRDRGLAFSGASDVWRVSFDDGGIDLPAGATVPNEVPIHTEIMRARDDVGCVIHAHPPEALLCGLAGLDPRPVFGAFNIPAMRLACKGVPVFGRPILVTKPELAGELVEAMGESQVCVMVGHGITVVGASIQQATVTALNLNELLTVTLELARLGVDAPEVTTADLRELPDLGATFNDDLVWSALVAELPPVGPAPTAEA